MTDPRTILSERFAAAFSSCLGTEHAGRDPMIRPSVNPKFGDYQANFAMQMARDLGTNPRQLATKVRESVDLGDVCESVEVAGPGFLNLTLRRDFLERLVTQLADDPTLGIEPDDPAETVVVDYSAPNIAKEMHVGHLRSTVIGDAICRVLLRLGHTVIRQNHVGDWGTQFGMLIEYLVETSAGSDQAIAELNHLYRDAKARFDADEDFRERARQRVVALQAGDAESVRLWEELVARSRTYFAGVYERMNVLLDDADVRGESAYNDRLAATVADLEASGLAVLDQGAKVVFQEEYRNQEGEPLGMVVQKSDGGYLYATTDLAAIRYRIQDLGCTRLVYVTDSRQSDHFGQIFWTARKAGWAGPQIQLEHVPFGTVLGDDRKPLKTRDGTPVLLASLLDEAEERAAQANRERGSPDLDETTRSRIAHVVGIGGLKYADLSSERIKDYVFDWDRMLALQGNTAPYIQYSYTRVRSIFRKGELDSEQVTGPIHLGEPAEREIALQLLEFGNVVRMVASSLEPHRLCTYLYDLASSFHAFFESCPVLKADDDLRRSRLRLCDLTARVLKQGLGLLGIEVVEQM